MILKKVILDHPSVEYYAGEDLIYNFDLSEEIEEGATVEINGDEPSFYLSKSSINRAIKFAKPVVNFNSDTRIATIKLSKEYTSSLESNNYFFEIRMSVNGVYNIFRTESFYIKDSSFSKNHCCHNLPLGNGCTGNVEDKLDKIEKGYKEADSVLRSNLSNMCNLRKLTDYLHEITFNNGVDYEYGTKYMLSKFRPVPGGCTEVKMGKFVGRNLDLVYNELNQFVVKVNKGKNVKYNSIGVAMSTNWDKEEVENSPIQEKYAALPFMTLDGINEKGVMVAVNVVPIPTGSNNSLGTKDDATKSYSISMMARYVLDNFESAYDAIDSIIIKNNDDISWFQPKIEAFSGLDCYEYHIFIADSEKSYVVEMINRELIYKECSAMTNFHVTQFEYDEDGKVIVPPYKNSNGEVIKYDDIINLGSGIERFNYCIQSIEDNLHTIEYVMDHLYYTNAYKEVETGDWNSEYVSKEEGKCTLPHIMDSTDPERNEYIENTLIPAVKYWFLRRSRDKNSPFYGTWHTMNSSVYNLEDCSLHVRVQENNSEVFDFYLSDERTSGEGGGEPGTIDPDELIQAAKGMTAGLGIFLN